MSVILQCLLLLVVANGAPILARNILKGRFSQAVDGNILFMDGKPLLGNSKTLRGIFASVCLTGIVSLLLGSGFVFGALFGLCAMLGDLASSFLKRRLSLQPSSMAPGIDQIPEALLPILVFRQELELSWSEITIIVCAFIVTELLLSRILFKLKIRQHPY